MEGFRVSGCKVVWSFSFKAVRCVFDKEPKPSTLHLEPESATPKKPPKSPKVQGPPSLDLKPARQLQTLLQQELQEIPWRGYRRMRV